MSKKRKKPKKRNFNTEPASSRIFYRKPSVMLDEFFCSGAGLTVVPLLFGAAIMFWHAVFIKTFS